MRLVSIVSALVVGLLAASSGCGDGPAPDLGNLWFVPDGYTLDFNRVYLAETDIGESSNSDSPGLALGIYAHAIDGLHAGGFRVTYDPGMLDLVEVKPGDHLRSFGSDFDSDNFEAGEVMFGFVLDSPRADAVLGYLVFEAPVEGSSAVEFAEPPAGATAGIRRLSDRRGYQRYGVRWIGGTMTRSDPIFGGQQ